jgi:hypothetical protein
VYIYVRILWLFLSREYLGYSQGGIEPNALGTTIINIISGFQLHQSPLRRVQLSAPLRVDPIKLALIPENCWPTLAMIF